MAASAADTISVVLMAKDPQNNRMFVVGADTTIEEIKRLWEESLGRCAGSIIRSSDRSQLDDHTKLGEVGEVSPGCKTVTVFVEAAIEVFVQLYKGHIGERKSMTISLNNKPEDMHAEIRGLFRLEDDECFRLRTVEAPLKYDMRLEQQRIEAGGELLIDVGLEVDVMEDWTSSVEKRLMFRSEEAADLLSEEKKPQRLLLGGVEMEVKKDMVSALPRAYRQLSKVFVKHQQQRDITTLVNSLLRQRCMWPTDVVGKLLERCPPVQSEVYFENAKLSTVATMKELKLPEHAVVHTMRCVTVKGSDDKFRIVCVPKMGTVADVEAEVSKTERTMRFWLTCGGRVVERSDKLSQVLIDGQSMEVERAGDTLTVCLADRCVRLRSGQSRMSFTEVMEKVSGKGGLPMESLIERRLQCQGCGRMLTQAEEAFQAIPADCCRVRSLKLTEPPARKDAGTQGSCWIACGKARRKRRRRRKRTFEAALQTEKRTAVVSTQHSPRALVPFHFRIFNHFGVGMQDYMTMDNLDIYGNSIETNLMFQNSTPTVEEVRVAAAAHLKVSPETIKMLRRTGRRKRDGEIVYRAWNIENDEMGFVNITGRWSSDDEVHVEDVELQGNDAFPVIQGFRISVFCFSPSFTLPRLFRIFNSFDVGRRAHVTMDDTDMIGHVIDANLTFKNSGAPTAGQVRVAAAAELNVSPNEIRLFRRTGRRKWDGELVYRAWDIGTEDMGFVSINGVWSNDDEVHFQDVELQENYTFPLIQGFRTNVFCFRLSFTLPRSFRIFNSFGVGEYARVKVDDSFIYGHVTDTNLMFQNITPTTREVRVAAAAHLNVAPETVRLLRRTGLSERDGEVVYRAWKIDNGDMGFVDVNGRWSSDNEVHYEDVELQDNDPFPMVQGFRISAFCHIPMANLR